MQPWKRPIFAFLGRLRARRAWLLAVLGPLSLLVLLLDLSQATGPDGGRFLGPRSIHFETPEVTLGRLSPGTTHTVELPWRRTGLGLLRVLEARADCGCALIETVPARLAAGARGVVRVHLTAPARSGPLRHRVRIVTDAAYGHDVHDIWISGHVGTDVAVRPTVLDLPAGRAGETVSQVVEVAWDRLSRHAAEPPPTARLIGLEGDVSVAPPARPGADGVQLIVTVRRPAKPGRLDGWLEIDLGRRGPLAVRVRGSVYPARPEAGGGGAR